MYDIYTVWNKVHIYTLLYIFAGVRLLETKFSNVILKFE